MSEAPKKKILLVSYEELFVDLLQRFPPARYPLIFAGSMAEAATTCADQKPSLLVVPVEDFGAPGIGELLGVAAKAGTKVLAVTDDRGPLPHTVAERIERSCRDDPDEILGAAAEILQERRNSPRVAVDIPVRVGGKPGFQATVISGSSLFIPTDEPLARGRMVKIDVDGGGDNRFSCWTKVVRVGPGESGQGGMVLGVPERESALRGYLDGVVRSAMLLARAELGDNEGQLPAALSRKLVQRLQVEVDALRHTLHAQVSFTDALSQRLDTLAEAEAKAVKWDAVEPLLARRLSAQRQMIKAILERVDSLASDAGAAAELRSALELHNELHAKLENQEAMITLLRGRLDEVGAGAAAGSVSPARQASLERTVAAQAELINELAYRVEQANKRSAAPALAAAQQRIDEQSEQLLALGAQVKALQDQLRLGHVPPQIDAIAAQAQRRADALEQQRAVLDSDDLEEIGDAVAEILGDEDPTAPGIAVDPVYAEVFGRVAEDEEHEGPTRPGFDGDERFVGDEEEEETTGTGGQRPRYRTLLGTRAPQPFPTLEGTAQAPPTAPDPLPPPPSPEPSRPPGPPVSASPDEVPEAVLLPELVARIPSSQERAAFVAHIDEAATTAVEKPADLPAPPPPPKRPPAEAAVAFEPALASDAASELSPAESFRETGELNPPAEGAGVRTTMVLDKPIEPSRPRPMALYVAVGVVSVGVIAALAYAVFGGAPGPAATGSGSVAQKPDLSIAARVPPSSPPPAVAKPGAVADAGAGGSVTADVGVAEGADAAAA
ncbi:MAG: hypothetical protein KC503_24900, partial [Myxococcales bacterium]|nr:hypothetical protein [Myxococcales bacterium]